MDCFLSNVLLRIWRRNHENGDQGGKTSAVNVAEKQLRNVFTHVPWNIFRGHPRLLNIAGKCMLSVCCATQENWKPWLRWQSLDICTTTEQSLCLFGLLLGSFTLFLQSRCVIQDASGCIRDTGSQVHNHTWGNLYLSVSTPLLYPFICSYLSIWNWLIFLWC